MLLKDRPYKTNLYFSTTCRKKHVKKQGVANKPLQRAPEASQNAPKMYQDPIDTSRDAPRWTQDGAKIPPRGRQMPPKRRLTPPRRSQDASKMTLGRPNPPPRRPKSPPDPPKMTLTPSLKTSIWIQFGGFAACPLSWHQQNAEFPRLWPPIGLGGMREA